VEVTEEQVAQVSNPVKDILNDFFLQLEDNGTVFQSL